MYESFFILREMRQEESFSFGELVTQCCWLGGLVEIRIHRKFRGFPACSQPLSNVNWFVNNVWIVNVMVMASEGIGPF